eukprot:TRINITY_DN1216_c0_g1_i12.p1 TRINITY_DN1216_c0_g1~~TRINITY_DN1216_c0_g1_i12.p1  ORF type:complete len:502 (-),score=83.05 TRINITY_DN1216_c0_g1_i12:733-2187(-)
MYNNKNNNTTIINYEIQGRNISIELCTDDIVDIRSRGVMIGSFAQGSDISKGSIGRIVEYYRAQFGVDIRRDVLESQFVYRDGLPSGMEIGRVTGVPRTELCSSLWFVQLNEMYGPDDLAVLYGKLKHIIGDILQFTDDGSLTLPLIGAHPRQGVNPSDVFEEVLSLLMYSSMKYPQVTKITLLVRSDTISELLNFLNPGQNYSSLLPTHTEEKIDDMREISGRYNVPAIIKECLSTIIVIWDCLRPHLESSEEHQLAFIFTVCGQGRKILEYICRLLSGDRSMNAGFRQVEMLVNQGLLPSKSGEICNKIVRSGNKAVHTDSEGSSLTMVDANLSLSAILYLLDSGIDLSERNQPLPTERFGDWICQCGTNNFSFRENCFSCSASKNNSAPMSTTGISSLSGDWSCPSCQTNNFASRTHCFSCSAPKSEMNTFSGQVLQPSSSVKPGDWSCPRCQTNNFASRNQCYSCSAPKIETNNIFGSED